MNSTSAIKEPESTPFDEPVTFENPISRFIESAKDVQAWATNTVLFVLTAFPPVRIKELPESERVAAIDRECAEILPTFGPDAVKACNGDIEKIPSAYVAGIIKWAGCQMTGAFY